MTPRECGASESARSLRSRARVRAHPAPAFPGGRDEERTRVRVRVRKRKREKESEPQADPEYETKWREGGRFHRTLSRTAASVSRLVLYRGLVPLRPLPLTVPTPGVSSHTTGTATWSALLPCYTTTTTISLPLFRSHVSSCRVP